MGLLRCTDRDIHLIKSVNRFAHLDVQEHLTQRFCLIIQFAM